MPRFLDSIFGGSNPVAQQAQAPVEATEIAVASAVTAVPVEVTEPTTAVAVVEATAVTTTPEIAEAQAVASDVTTSSEAPAVEAQAEAPTPTSAPTIFSRVAGGAAVAVEVGAVHGAAFAGFAPAYLGREVFVLGREGVHGNIQPTTMHRVEAAVADIGIGGAIAGLIAGVSLVAGSPVTVPLLTAAFTLGGASHLYGIGDAAVNAAERAFTRQGQAAENHEVAQAPEAPALAIEARELAHLTDLTGVVDPLHTEVLEG